MTMESKMDKRSMESNEPEIPFPEPSPWLRKEMEREVEKEQKRGKERQRTGPYPYFGKFPHWIADSGVLEVLRPKAVKLVILLVRRADFITQNGRIGNETISKKCDIGEKSVSGYYKEVQSFGIIKSWRHGWGRYYHICGFPPPGIQKKVEFYRKPDRYPKDTDTYPRDPKTGRFVKKDNLPKNSDVAYPKNTEPA